jgi:hypothetical protein
MTIENPQTIKEAVQRVVLDNPGQVFTVDVFLTLVGSYGFGIPGREECAFSTIQNALDELFPGQVAIADEMIYLYDAWNNVAGGTGFRAFDANQPYLGPPANLADVGRGSSPGAYIPPGQAHESLNG